MSYVVKVFSQEKIEEYAMQKHDKTSIVISIHSKAGFGAFIKPNNISNIKHVLFIDANDTDMDDEFSGGLSDEQAVEIRNFLESYIDSVDEVLVNCEAGQSRSAGVAAAIMKAYNDDDMDIFNNHMYTPNMLFYRKVLNQLV